MVGGLGVEFLANGFIDSRFPAAQVEGTGHALRLLIATGGAAAATAVTAPSESLFIVRPKSFCH